MKRLIYIISICVCILVMSCKHHKEKSTEEKFLVTSVMVKDTLVYKSYVCQIHSIQHIELRALEKGYLQKIAVDEGQQVKKGQLLFQIMPAIYQAETQKAAAEVEYAQIEYLTTKKLADSNIVSQNELLMSKAKLSKAIAELELAQTHLGFTEIRAAFDGFVGLFHVRQGSLLDEGDLLSTLSDNSKMWVYFNVPEAEYLSYIQTKTKDGHYQEVELQMANNQMFDHKGIIETIEADFNNETGNIAFRATFLNPLGILRHGETGNILMPVPLKNALLIPQKATFEVLEKKHVFVVDEKNIVHSREIQVGVELPHLFVVTGGLKPGDKILLEGLRKVKDLQQINYEFIEPEKAMSALDDLHAE
jgi:membrane fusion protein (multidrug efflux system)